MSQKYLIIGGVACGPKAAARLRRLDPQAEITIIEKGELLSYGCCGLPYYISGDVKDIRMLWSSPTGVPRDKQFFRKVKNIEVVDRTLAEKIDRIGKKVETIHLDTGEKTTYSYDKLILAVGGIPTLPPIEGIQANHVFKLNHPYDAEGIGKAILHHDIREAVIIGGGLIGLEMTEALTKRGIKVTVVEMLNRLLPKLLDQEMAMLLMQHMQSNGVTISVNNRVLKFNADDQGNLASVVTEQGSIAAQLALVSIGVKANNGLALDAGLELCDDGSICVNEYLQTSDPDIYAGGDCVNNEHTVLHKRLYTPLGDLANIHGRIIANNIHGITEKFEGITGTCICQVFDYNVASTGLTEEAARDAGHDVVTVIAPGPDKPHFFPTAQFIFIKLIGEADTGKILGAQILGPGDVAKRINIVSLGLMFGIDAMALAKLDLAYAPPFSPAIDNIMMAANIMQNKMLGIAKSITAIDLKKKLDAGEDLILLDVRSPQELRNIALPYGNCVNIPLGELRERYAELHKEKEIILYCMISQRGYEAQRILEEKGFLNVKFLDGGIVAWPYEKKASQ